MPALRTIASLHHPDSSSSSVRSPPPPPGDRCWIVPVRAGPAGARRSLASWWLVLVIAVPPAEKPCDLARPRFRAAPDKPERFRTPGHLPLVSVLAVTTDARRYRAATGFLDTRIWLWPVRREARSMALGGHVHNRTA